MIKLHIDTDIGGDIDDLCALAMVLNLADVELIGVTTVAEHQGKRAGYAKYALALAGREDVLVAAGADASAVYYRWWPGLPEEAAYWPEPIESARTSVEEALSLLEHNIGEGAVVAAIGPFTNLSLLEKRLPGILQNSRLFLMGGYVSAPREGFPQWGNDMDYNVQVDVESAHYVIERSKPTLVTLAATVETSLRRAYLKALKQSGPLGQLLATQAEAFARDEQMETRYGQTCAGLPSDIINFLHDPLACAVAAGWNDGVHVSDIPIETVVEDGWIHQRIRAGATPTRVVTRVDGDMFGEFWLKTTAATNSSSEKHGLSELEIQ